MKLNRRKVLASLGMLGAGSAIGGVGTYAYLSDRESTVTTATAGELDIKLDWKAFHNEEQIAMQTPTDVDGAVAANFSDVKPGDTGCFSLSIHNDTNPAWVWLAMDITDETDGDGDDNSQDAECPPTQYPWVCGQNETDGNVTVSSDGTNLIIEITPASSQTLEETSVDVGTSMSDIETTPGGPAPGQFPYKYDDSGQSLTKYTIPLSDIGVECGDSVVIAVHGAESGTDGETCWAGSTEIPGANWALAINHEICCDSSSSSAKTSGSVLADNILVDVFWDDDGDCEIDPDETVLFKNITLRNLAANINKSSGGIMPQWYSTGTQYISLAWEIPSQVGNEIQGDTVDVEFNVYAVQRRHNDNPDNPWK